MEFQYLCWSAGVVSYVSNKPQETVFKRLDRWVAFWINYERERSRKERERTQLNRQATPHVWFCIGTVGLTHHTSFHHIKHLCRSRLPLSHNNHQPRNICDCIFLHFRRNHRRNAKNTWYYITRDNESTKVPRLQTNCQIRGTKHVTKLWLCVVITIPLWDV